MNGEAPSGRSVGSRSGDAVVKSHAQRLQEEVARERVKREARRLLDAEERCPGPELPPIQTLAERLTEPLDPVRWRIDGWLPAGGRAVLVAPMKVGKTTLIVNLIRSLLDGEPWLGHCSVAPLTGTLAIVDTEMSGQQLTTWYREAGIGHSDRAIPIALRQRATQFNLCDDRTRARWAEELRKHRVEFLVLDCLRPVLDAIGLDEHREIGRFLVAFDAMLQAAGIREAIVVHHSGHGGTRSRGDSRVRDWPDVEWFLRLGKDDPASPRYISAFGRDVDVKEIKLDYTRDDRRLSIGAGSRFDSAVDEAFGIIVDVIRSHDALMTGRNLEAECIRIGQGRDIHRAAIRQAMKRGVMLGMIRVEAGPKRAQLYSLIPEFASAPEFAVSAPAGPAPGRAPVRRRS